MLTGDRPESAAIVAKELHLDEYRAGCSPKARPPSWNRSAPGSPYFL